MWAASLHANKYKSNLVVVQQVNMKADYTQGRK